MKEFDRSRLARNLTHLHAARGVKQADIAKATGIHPQTIANYEKGVSVPSYDAAWLIAEFYGVSIDALYSESIDALVSN